MALTNPCFKDQNWSHLGRGNRGEEKEKRRREEEEPRSRQQGMETTLGYGLYEIMYELPCLVG